MVFSFCTGPTTLPSVVPTTKVTEPSLSTEHEYTTQLQRTTKTSTGIEM